MRQNSAKNQAGRKLLFVGSIIGLSFFVYETAFSVDPNLTAIQSVSAPLRENSCDMGEFDINQSESIQFVSFENGKKFSRSTASEPTLLVKPGPTQIHLAPFYKNGAAYVLNWRAWIDADGNGEYVSSEEVLSARGSGALNRVIDIPYSMDAKARIRVAMSFGTLPTSCAGRGNDILDVSLVSDQMQNLAMSDALPAIATVPQSVESSNATPATTVVGTESATAATPATVAVSKNSKPSDFVEPARIDSAKLYSAAADKKVAPVKKMSAKSAFALPELPANLDRTQLKDVGGDELLADIKGNILFEVMENWAIKAKPLLEAKVYAVIFQNGNIVSTVANYAKLSNDLSTLLGTEPVCAVTLHHRNLNSIGEAGVMKGELIRMGHPIFGISRIETPKDGKPSRISLFQSDANKNGFGAATAIMCWGSDPQRRERVSVAEFHKTIPFLKVRSFEFPQPKLDASIMGE